jgi:hypothetical protein
MAKNNLEPCLLILKKTDKDGNRLTRNSEEFKACNERNNVHRRQRAKESARRKAMNASKKANPYKM